MTKRPLLKATVVVCAVSILLGSVCLDNDEDKDIDSARGLIHVRQGKGNKDREVPLSPRLLQSLRKYYKQYRPPGEYMFPGRSKDEVLSKNAFAKV